MLTEKIIKRAKDTEYKHKDWFREGGKSVYDAIEYYANSGDFYIDTTIKYYSQLPKEFFTEYLSNSKEKPTKRQITDWLIENEMYDKLVIRYNGREGGNRQRKVKDSDVFDIERLLCSITERWI